MRDLRGHYAKIAALMATAPCLLLIVEIERLNFRLEHVDDVLPREFVLGALGIILLIEGLRRAVVPAMAALGCLAIAYLLTSEYFPEILHYRDIEITEAVELLYLLTDEGMFGSITGISATFVALFVIFGAFVHVSGTGRFFTKLACKLAGRAHGGPAKIAVVSSGFFGAISGVAAANVYTTGTFSIPLMFVMVASITLGMGLPCTPAYIIAAYAGAALAGANPLKTGMEAFALALGGFLVPYVFYFDQALLMRGDFLDILSSVLRLFFMIVMLAVALQGWLLKRIPLAVRGGLIALSVSLPVVFSSKLQGILVGMAVLTLLYVVQSRSVAEEKTNLARWPIEASTFFACCCATPVHEPCFRTGTKSESVALPRPSLPSHRTVPCKPNRGRRGSALPTQCLLRRSAQRRGLENG